MLVFIVSSNNNIIMQMNCVFSFYSCLIDFYHVS